MFHQPVMANFYLDSDKFMASPFSFSVHNKPSLLLLIIIIIIIIIFLLLVRCVAYSECPSLSWTSHISPTFATVYESDLGNSLSIRS